MTVMLNSGKSALFAFQRALATTAHNIANVNTEGYARQRVDLDAVSADSRSANSVGRGVRIAEIQRLNDEFATSLVSTSTSAHAEMTVHHQMASHLDYLVATDGMSIAPALDNFFNALHDANSDPSSTASREVVIESINQLAARFQILQARLDESQEEVNARTEEAVKTVDQFAQSIADINRRIIGTSASAYSQQAHDLHDQRAQLVNELSEYMEVDTLIQDNGAMSVFIGKGVSLVTDAVAQPLTTIRDDLYPDRVEIQIGETGKDILLSASIQGGIIGGLNDFSDDTLKPAMHELGRLALTIADEINTQHALGVDLHSTPGGNVFRSVEPEIFASNLNTGNGIIRGRITDTTALSASDYTLRFDGVNFTATRESDGRNTTSGMPMSIDGLALTLTGTPVAGDVFVVSATGRAAGALETLINSPEKLALSGQLSTSSDVSNLGDAKISQASVIDPEAIALTSPINISFTSGSSYNIVDSGSGAVLKSDVYLQDQPIQFNGWEVSINGDAKSGDVFRVKPNVNGRGNNSNGLQLASMQTQLFVDGTKTFNDAYGALVARIGSQTSSAKTRADALESLRNNAIDKQQTLQGVSLDEEAVNLTRYQQAYQAAAQVIATSEVLFDAILGAVRR